jgi:hypothetical protein
MPSSVGATRGRFGASRPGFWVVLAVGDGVGSGIIVVVVDDMAVTYCDSLWPASTLGMSWVPVS